MNALFLAMSFASEPATSTIPTPTDSTSADSTSADSTSADETSTATPASPDPASVLLQLQPGMRIYDADLVRQWVPTRSLQGVINLTPGFVVAPNGAVYANGAPVTAMIDGVPLLRPAAIR